MRSTPATASSPRAPTFADEVVAAGITWVGPSPEALRLGGDKLAAKRIARRGRRTDAASGLPEEIGFPLVVKASAGGGGRGMRVVRSAAELEEALAAAEREAEASVRRRHGVLRAISRTSSPCRSPAARTQRRRSPSSAAATARSNGGTRNCSRNRPLPGSILAPGRRSRPAQSRSRRRSATGTPARPSSSSTGADVYFLELNGRIQVEHPVTEELTGLDIVELQLRVADGEDIDLDVAPRGHAVEARLYAEDPRTFLPQAGRIERLVLPGGDPRRRGRGGGGRDRARRTTRCSQS